LLRIFRKTASYRAPQVSVGTPLAEFLHGVDIGRAIEPGKLEGFALAIGKPAEDEPGFAYRCAAITEFLPDALGELLGSAGLVVNDLAPRC
jgi:hypothetical protein